MNMNQTDLSTDIQADVPLTPMASTLISKANSNETDHSLKDMLERFVLIETFKWKTDSPLLPMQLTQTNYMNSVKTYMKSYLLPQALIDASSLIRQKLNNFMLMKADMEIDIKVNATPFQQGELLVAYFPRSLSTSRFRAEGSEFLAAVTSAPHRRLKPEAGNALTFRVPYANVRDYIDLTSLDNTFGVLHIYVLSALKGESSMEEVDVTVRLRFVDVELKAPTNASVLTSEYYRQKEIASIMHLENRTAPAGLHAQMAEGEKEGPVTRIASAVGTIGETLSGVPVIGAAAGMLGWFARAVAGVASVFGWSKAGDLTMPRANVHRTAAYMGNTEGKDASCMLAQIPDNAIDSFSMNPSTMDEMALSTIFSRPNLVGRITVPKNQFTGSDLLFSWEVSPFNYLTQQLDSNGQDFCLGSFSFTSMLYKLWRGSIKYSLSVVKTQYHSGRVLVVYFPNRTRIQIPATSGELMTTNSNMIYDLVAKADDEFSLEKPIVIPYTSDEPWKRTLYKNDNGLYDASTMNTCVGTIGVYCLNELVCPPSVSQDVTFLLSVQAGDDYEVAIPQLQLQGGFAMEEAPPVNIAPELVEILNRLYSNDQYVPPGALGAEPTIYSDPDFGMGTTTIQQFVEPTEWLLCAGEALALPDGVYDTSIQLTFTSGETLFENKAYDFSVTVRDGLIETVHSEYLVLLIESLLTESVFIAASEPLVAQMSDGASEPIPSMTTIADITSHSDISKSTTGEYAKSLRPLIKRFVKTRIIDATQPVSLTPADFVNYDSQSPVLPVGNRAWASENNGGLVPESWLNMVSYLFRFFSGSVRSKVFIPFNVQATTSLDVTDTAYTEFDTPLMDPAFVSEGVINNAIETTVPYYGQHRARTIGDALRGLGAKQRIELSGTGTFDYYEAAGDDASMWFMIGPPIMRPFDVNPTAPALVVPQTPAPKSHKFKARPLLREFRSHKDCDSSLMDSPA